MLFHFLDSLDWSVSFLLVAAVFILFTTIGIFSVRKTLNLQHIKDCHDMTGIIFSNLGALYAVLLGFTIVNAQERFDRVKASTQVEAACLIDLYRDSEFFVPKDQKIVKQAIITYVDSIINKEWSEKIPHHDTGKKFKELLHAYYNVEVETQKQNIWYSKAVDQLNNLADLRMARILGSQESIGPAMWTILILGGCAMIVFLCFFGPDKPMQHLIMACILAITIAFSLFLIHSLDTMFTGAVSIRSDEMGNLLQMLVEDFNGAS